MLLQRTTTLVGGASGGARRSLAAAAQQAVQSSHEPDVKSSRCPNGLLVTSIERQGVLARLAIAFRAGSRYETESERGCAHRLRNAVGLASRGHSAYELMWRAGVLGANVEVSSTRDLLIVSLDAWRDYAVPALEVLGELAARPAMRAWELADSDHQLATERAIMKLNPAQRAVELLHAAAYRNGALSHSLISPKHMIGKHKEPLMLEYARRHLLSGEAALVGINVDHEQLFAYAQAAPVTEGKALPLPNSPYIGGEMRKHTSGGLAHVLVAGECAGLNNAADGAAAAVLASILSAGPVIKYADTCGAGVAAAAAASAAAGSPHAVLSLHEAHANEGLVGVYCVAETDKIDGVVRGATNAIKSLASKGPSAEQLERAKTATLSAALMRAESECALREDAITQTLAGSAVTSTPRAIADAVSAVSQQDVQTLAKKLTTRPSLSAIGNLSQTPYLDELFN